MTNKGLLLFIAIILVGIFAILIVQNDNPDPVEQISNSVNETIEEVEDEIDDNTTAR